MVHVQAAHMMNIYELGVPKSDMTKKGDQTSQQTPPATSPCPCPCPKHDKEVVSKIVLLFLLFHYKLFVEKNQQLHDVTRNHDLVHTGHPTLLTQRNV
jgi:hypothetical protein